MDSVILARWSHRATADGRATIVPDGCRDLILRHVAGERPCWFLSPLDERTRHVPVLSGTMMSGFRLRPGTHIDEKVLLALARRPSDAEGALVDCIHAFSTLTEPLAEALACLAAGPPSVRRAAALLGVSPRTLQRLVAAQTGRSPSFWLRLARARRAGRALLQGEALSQVAWAHGYSDQAHMTREFRRWFGLTPRSARCESSLQLALRESGHG